MTSVPIRKTNIQQPSTYVPWTSSHNDGDDVPTMVVPPSSTGDEMFNSKVMRIKPVTVDLDALPSMMSSDDDVSDSEDEDSFKGDTKRMEGTDVDGLD